MGATGFDPELRAQLHLTHPDPALGRVRALLGDAADGDFDVLAFPLPDGVDRATAKKAVIAELAEMPEASGSTSALSTTVRGVIARMRGRFSG